MFAKSIRLRFQLWLGFLLIGILSGFGLTAFHFYKGGQWNQVDGELFRRVAAIAADVHRPPGPGGPGGRGGPMGPPPDGEGFNRMPPPDEGFRGGPGPRRGGPGEDGFRDRHGFDGEFRGPPMGPREVRLSARTLGFFDESETNGFYFAVWSGQGNLLKQSTNAPANLAHPTRLERDTAIRTETRLPFREAYQFGQMGDCILVGRSVTDIAKSNSRFAMLLFAAGAGVLAIGLGGAWIIASRALRPVQDIGIAASRISGGNLSERINVEDTDSELGQLAKLLNATFGRLESAFAQQKQFTADAAHELRTPLAVIISESQTTLARPRNAEEYRETVEACLETAQRMRALTHSLLELARFDAGQEPIARAPLHLAELVQDRIVELAPLAREKNVLLTTELTPVTVLGDDARLGQVITNLVSNAIYYNKDGGEVRITVSVENGAAILKVSDTGQGIAAEHLPHIFERFYRADSSRSGANGRSGLGLAISKAIVDAHGGSIDVTSALDQGSEFKVRLPAASAS